MRIIGHEPLAEGEWPTGLTGGLLFMARSVTVDVRDPSLPYLLELQLVADGLRLVCDRVTARRRDGEGPITGAALRGAVLDTYARAVMEEATRRGLVRLGKVHRDEDGGYLIGPLPGVPSTEQLARHRRAARGVDSQVGAVGLETVVKTYREVLAEPGQTARATEETALRLGRSRGHVSRLLSQARQLGLLEAWERGPGRVPVKDQPAVRLWQATQAMDAPGTPKRPARPTQGKRS